MGDIINFERNTKTKIKLLYKKFRNNRAIFICSLVFIFSIVDFVLCLPFIRENIIKTESIQDSTFYSCISALAVLECIFIWYIGYHKFDKIKKNRKSKEKYKKHVK